MDWPDIRDYIDNETMRRALEEIEGVALLDTEGRFLYVNKSWSDLMGGISLEEIRGKRVKDLFPETKLEEVLISGKPVSYGEVTLLGSKEKAFGAWRPIILNGQVKGAFFYIILRDMYEAQGLAAETQRLTRQLEFYKEELSRIQGARYSLENIIGKSPAMEELRQAVTNSARSSSTVLIYGETGCGKELVAHALHCLSPRYTAPFVKVNCSAIPQDLMESEFFGYEPGSFTGASKRGNHGKFELANGGSLFLDEINQMSLSLQPKLLRVLQEKEIERIGGHVSIPVNVRVISATNIPLEVLVEKGEFRQDLFYRLNVISICVPPLRERITDIPELCDHILKTLNQQLGYQVPEVADEVKERFMEYSWPGNVRELQNVLERGMNNAWQGPVKWEHVADYFSNHSGKFFPGHQKNISIREARCQQERILIQSAILQCCGNKAQAAELLGLSRSMLYKKLKDYNL